MNCITTGFTIPGDETGSLNKLVDSLSNGNEYKALLIASYFGSERFADFLEKETGERDYNVLKKKSWNKLRKLVRTFYEEGNLRVSNTANRRQGTSFIFGFESVEAMRDAQDHTITLIIDEYKQAVVSGYSANKTLSNVSSKIIDNFFKVYGREAWVSLPSNHPLKKQYKDEFELYDSELKKQNKAKEANIKLLKETKDKEEKKAIKAELKRIDSQITRLKNGVFKVLYEAANAYGNNRIKTYANLALQVHINPNSWYDKVFGSRLINKYKAQFENTIDNENIDIAYYEDESNFAKEADDSVDLESRRWVDNVNSTTDFTQNVDLEIKLYLAGIKKLNSPTKITRGESTDWDYDTSNTLGTATTVGAEWLMLQLSNLGSFYSIPMFIESMKQKARSIPGLQCLAIIAEDCEKSPSLAHKLFHELANPKMTKAIIDVDGGAYKNSISNTAVNPVSFVLYNLQNIAKFTIKDNFDENQFITLEKLISRINSGSVSKENIEGASKHYDPIIIGILSKYFPQIDVNAIKSYLTSGNNYTANYIGLIENIKSLLDAIETIIDTENKLVNDYNAKKAVYNKRLQDGLTAEKPTIDYDAIPYEKMNSSLVEIAKKIAPYMAVNNELNSFNAAGNMGSDLIENNNLTNLIQQINYGTKEDPDLGLRRLGEFVFNVPQYKDSPIYWGIYDNQGREIMPGLFIKGIKGFTINPKAKTLLSVSLFNGVRDQVNDKSELYATMSKVDYFMSTLISFYQPALHLEQREESDMAGYFLRTPSDAPKNFVINSKRIDSAGLYQEDSKSKRDYLTKYGNMVMERLKFGTKNGAKNIRTNRTETVGKKGRTNQIELSELLDIIIDTPKSYDYTGKVGYKIGNKTGVNLTVKVNNTYVNVLLLGDKTIEGTNFILNNITIDSAYSRGWSEDKGLDQDIKQAIADELTARGARTGEIKTNFNRSHGLYLAFKQQLFNELNNLIFNLNNVLDRNVPYDQGWTIKTDDSGLFDRYHRNGKIVDYVEVVEDGKKVKKLMLTGNVFTLNKLFDTSSYSAVKELMKALYLYGQGKKAILTKVDDTFVFNKENPTTFFDTTTNEIKLRTDSELNIIIEDIVEKWMNAFVQDIRKESQQYKSIVGDRFNDQQIVNCMLNAAFMEMNFDDLFEGDSKFYKDSRDFFKRAKEVQASGKSYGATDFSKGLGTALANIKDANNENEVIRVAGVEIPVRDGFKGATIKNTVRPSDNAEALYNELLKTLPVNLPQITKERIALQIAKGYGYKNEKRGATKTNDAQSYITVEEWIRRTYLAGDLEKYKDIIPALLDENADISKLDIQKINKFVQVQKNFYFDKQFDPFTSTMYPRQIKNAEYVLIPSLIKGTSLETLYKTMKEAGIDQINTVETDKAAKRAILEFWDNNGKVTNAEKFKADLSNARNQESYYYRYLYKQQSVAQHMQDMKNKAGIQIMKKILDNNDPAVKAYIDQFFDAYIANIKADYDAFLKAMDWRIEDGKIVNKHGSQERLNFAEFYKRAKAEAERLGLDSNFADYVTTDLYGDPIMPNFMNIAATKFESIAQSMFNNAITRQKLPGWHAAQVTNVGYASDLKFDPETGVMQVRLPRWSKLIPKDYDINQLKEAGLTIHIGYRIPTEGKQSVAILEVVDILDDVQGSTIVVPDEWVTKTGSDFDVDSVYGISYEMYVDPKTGKLHKVKANMGTDTASLNQRYLNRIRKELDVKLKEDKQQVFYDLSTATHQIKSIQDVNKLMYTKAGLDFVCDTLDIISYDEFAELPLIEQQSHEARNNMILDAMVEIMRHSSTREENYSRSNFDNLTDAKNLIDGLRKAHFGEGSKVESVHNPLDQITYMENAISGRSLKAFSVTRDTFNSVANFSKAQLSDEHTIAVTYNLSEKDSNGNFLYDKNLMKESYGNDFHDNKDGTVTITHRRYAWSENNRNVVGMLITPYSSQTTAHILDAIKEGSIFNENKFTFGTFKTLVDLGIDYTTAIAFLQQPAVTEIVKAYNETNSIYTNSNGKPIEIALNRIAKAAGIQVNGKSITDDTSQYLIWEALARNVELQQAINSLCGGHLTEKGTIKDGVITLNGKLLQERFNGSKISETENNYDAKTLAFDILTLLNFKKIYNTTQNIEKIIRCTNPDKFGAKQSIFSTRNVIQNILDYTSPIKNQEIGNTIMVGNESILTALYPGIEKGDIDTSKSCYRYLGAFMKYATMTSIEINKQLFDLDSDYIYQQMLELQNELNIKFSDERAKAFKQYVITDIYNSVPEFFTPFGVDEYGWFYPITEDIYPDKNDFYDNEVDRLNGYRQFSSVNIELSSLTKPSKDDIIKFNLLTPAQKIVFIRNHFESDGLGVFKYLNVNRYRNKDIIKYNDTLGDIENIFIDFNNSFFNKNPLIAIATLDLIKYAFVVEGFKFKKGGISKIVSNDALLATQTEKGLDLVGKITKAFDDFMVDEDFKEKFIRSHSQYLKPVYVGRSMPNTFSKFMNDSFIKDNVFFIPNINEDAQNTIRRKLNIDVNEGIPTGLTKYVKLSRKVNKTTETTLYKLNYKVDGIYGYPLNLLEADETCVYSYNDNNNKYKVSQYYKNIIDNHIHEFDTTYQKKNVVADDFRVPAHKTDNVKESLYNPNHLLEIAETGSTFEKQTVNNLFAAIQDWFNLPVESRTNIGLIHNESATLRSILPKGYFVRQYVPINNQNVLVELSRYKATKDFRKAINGEKYNKNYIKKHEANILEDVKASTIKSPSLYRVEIAVSHSLESNNASDTFQYDTLFGEEADGFYSTTPLIDDSDLVIEHEFNSIDQVAKDIADTIRNEHNRNPNDNTSNFMSEMAKINLDRQDTDNIHENSKDIYKEAAKFYSNKASDLLHRINHFSLGEEERTYNIGEKELYDKLVDHPEAYNDLIKLILDCYTFGNQFKDIAILDLVGEDESLVRDIKTIKDAINSITSNIHVRNAMKNIFNIYLAETVSQNPNIRHGLINLDTTFNDSGYLDSHISDIGFINNNKVQVVVKYINSKLDYAERFEIPKLVAQFESDYEDIMRMAGSVNMDNVVDEDGNLHKDCTKEFKEKFTELLNKVSEARANYGINSVQYWQAKLEKDEWFAENVHQPIVKQYYDKFNANNRLAFDNAREEFLEYQAILSELRSISGNPAELDRTQIVRRAELLNKLSFFTSKFNEDGSEKSADKVARLEFIKQYKKNKKAITDEFYDTSIIDEVKDKINTYSNYIKNYDEAHADETLEEKLTNERYRESYEWLKYNTTYEIDAESNEKLLEAYSKFSNGENDKRIRIAGILRGLDVYDERGKLDPTKIPLDKMKQIKALYETEETKDYEDNTAESRIVRAFKKPTVVATDEYYDILNDIYKDNPYGKLDEQTKKDIARTNELLLRGFEDGQLSAKKLFEELNDEELKELSKLFYERYVDDSVPLTKEDAAKIKNISTKKVKTAEFKAQLDWAMNNLNDTKFNIFISIFAAHKNDGSIKKYKKQFVANPILYSYRIPKQKYIDQEKTIAKRFINENISYDVTDAYKAERAKQEALGEDTYKEWYDANHIFNPYTHKMEPLSIWKQRVINPNGSLNATYEYNPAFEFLEREVKADKVNTKFNPDDHLNYNGVNYRNSIVLNDKEKAVRDLFQNVLNKMATTGAMRSKAREGFMPRRAKTIKDGKWYGRQAAASFGLDWTSQHDKTWSDDVAYETDKDAELNVLNLLRKKGSVDIRGIKRTDYATEEEYNKAIKDAKENNQQIDNLLRDKDYLSIMKDYIEKAGIYNIKEQLKYTSLLLIESLKSQDAIKINHRNNVSHNPTRSTNFNDVSNTIPQINTLEIVKNWHKRVFRNEFKTKSRFNEMASLLQNITSAKYMIFNITGGIANVWTGLGNIFGETLAGDFFNNKEFAEANSQYGGKIISMLAEMYSDKSSSLTNALFKRFNVVDYEAMSERRPNETTAEYIKRFRNFMYGLQSGGEHYMQNTAFLAMMKSHRIYENNKGKKTIVSFNQFIWETERRVLQEMIKDDELLYGQYLALISDIKTNPNDLYKLETLREDINIKFLRQVGDQQLIQDYIEAKEKAIKEAEKEFYDDSKHPTLESLFELKDGIAVLKDENSVDKFALGAFTNKVIYVNKKIHGVYDKIGAAQIEKHWWGTLVMQYHKHLYPGIMKRWRLNGYFNEQTGQFEKGSYISAMNLLTIDFDKAIKCAKDDADGQQIKVVLKSIQNVAYQALSNLRHLKTNYKLLPKWEQNNIRRAYADSINTLACIVMAIAIHVLADDDEIKESGTLSTAVYLADRFASEAQAFTPWGAYGEAKTLYSSPIASLNSPSDLIKLIGMTGQVIFDPEYETTYSTGLYKGRNKFEVLLTRNIPIVRVKNRLEMMSKNNQYYRLNQNMLNIIPVKKIGDALAGRD